MKRHLTQVAAVTLSLALSGAAFAGGHQHNGQGNGSSSYSRLNTTSSSGKYSNGQNSFNKKLNQTQVKSCKQL